MIEVLGRDSMAECYRVKVGAHVARIPDTVISSAMQLTGGRGHQTAYEWIARHSGEIETAIAALGAGHSARAPFDRLELEASGPGTMI